MQQCILSRIEQTKRQGSNVVKPRSCVLTTFFEAPELSITSNDNKNGQKLKHSVQKMKVPKTDQRFKKRQSTTILASPSYLQVTPRSPPKGHQLQCFVRISI
eukprot:6458988-Amphidinium_carterae.1